METKQENSPTASNIPVMTFEVKESSELMKFLIANLKGKSRENIKSLLSHHQVAVDGKMTTQFNHPLEIGQQVTFIAFFFGLAAVVAILRIGFGG